MYDIEMEFYDQMRGEPNTLKDYLCVIIFISIVVVIPMLLLWYFGVF